MEHDRRVRRREYDGTWSVLCDNSEGKKRNAPNDAAVHRDGANLVHRSRLRHPRALRRSHKAEFELPIRVFRIDGQTGKTTIIAEGPMRRPNGICFSPDFSKVYIVDTGATDGPDYPEHRLRRCKRRDGRKRSKGVCRL